MLKPNSLRKALTDAVPVLRTNPDMLHCCGQVFLDTPIRW